MQYDITNKCPLTELTAGDVWMACMIADYGR